MKKMLNTRRLVILLEGDKKILPFRGEDLPNNMILKDIIEGAIHVYDLPSKEISDYDFFSWDLKPLNRSIRVGCVPAPGIIT